MHKQISANVYISEFMVKDKGTGIFYINVDMAQAIPETLSHVHINTHTGSTTMFALADDDERALMIKMIKQKINGI